MTGTNLFCWKCGGSAAMFPLPLTRFAECPACHAYLHVCRMCKFFASGVPKQCREEDAEEVKEKERPNFCDYFRPNPNAYRQGDAKLQAAKSKLDSLFGDAGGESENRADAARDKLDEFFGKRGK